jgi:hypothetical protein
MGICLAVANDLTQIQIGENMRSRDGIIVALTVATAAFGLGVYTSAHGGDTSRIHGCVDNRTGALRIVGATQNCTAGKETALDWNIAGPTGPQGIRGPEGPQGPAGVPGVGSPRVINGAGSDIGALMGPDAVLITLFDGRKKFAAVTRNSVAQADSVEVYYTSDACDSTPLVVIPPHMLVGSMSAVGDSVYTNNSTTEQQRELRSVRSLTLSGDTGCQPLDMPITEWTGELEEFSLADVGLVGPFTVE